jgi:Cyclic nucleotide-binding domain
MQQQQPADADAMVRAIPVEEIARILARNPVFALFDRNALLAIAGKCSFATFPAGAVIMRQGDPGSFAHLILRGEAGVFVEIPAGRIPMSTLGRENTIGELGAFTDMPRTATVVARSNLVLLRMDRENLMSLAADYPVIATAIVGELGRRLPTTILPICCALRPDVSGCKQPASPLASNPIWTSRLARQCSARTMDYSCSAMASPMLAVRMAKHMAMFDWKTHSRRCASKARPRSLATFWPIMLVSCRMRRSLTTSPAWRCGIAREHPCDSLLPRSAAIKP